MRFSSSTQPPGDDARLHTTPPHCQYYWNTPPLCCGTHRKFYLTKTAPLYAAIILFRLQNPTRGGTPSPSGRPHNQGIHLLAAAFNSQPPRPRSASSTGRHYADKLVRTALVSRSMIPSSCLVWETDPNRTTACTRSPGCTIVQEELGLLGISRVVQGNRGWESLERRLHRDETSQHQLSRFESRCRLAVTYDLPLLHGSNSI